MNYVTKEDIIELRKKMGLSKVQFAKACGAKNGQLVTEWERGTCRPSGARYDKLLEFKGMYLPQPKHPLIPAKPPKPIKVERQLPLDEKPQWAKVGTIMDTFQELNQVSKNQVLSLLGVQNG